MTAQITRKTLSGCLRFFCAFVSITKFLSSRGIRTHENYNTAGIKSKLRKTQKGVERMDYWEYLAHGQGSERRGHRYYARELIGNKNGKNVYRYFYTADEYSAYKQNKGTPGRGTYAETGTSRSAIIWPKNTSRKRKAAEARNSVEQQKSAMDRERARTSVRAEKIKMDAEAYRKQRRQEKNSARNELKKKMDRDRIRTSIRAQKMKMDAKRYRRQKREMLKQKRAGQKRIMDNIRQRPYYQPTIKRGR